MKISATACAVMCVGTLLGCGGGDQQAAGGDASGFGEPDGSVGAADAEAAAPDAGIDPVGGHQLATSDRGRHVLADGTGVYWTVPDRGAIYRVDSDGSNRSLIEGDGYPGPIVMDELFLYWGSGSTLHRTAKTGSAATSVVAESDAWIIAMAQDSAADGQLYWTEAQAFRAPKSGGAPELLVADIAVESAIATDGDYVYYNAPTADIFVSVLMRVPADGSVAPEPFVGLENCDVLQVHGESLYCDGTRSTLDGSEVTVMTDTFGEVVGAVAVDADAVYYGLHSFGLDDGRIIRIPLSTGLAQELVTGIGQPNSLAVHQGVVYWTDNAHGGLWVTD